MSRALAGSLRAAPETDAHTMTTPHRCRKPRVRFSNPVAQGMTPASHRLEVRCLRVQNPQQFLQRAHYVKPLIQNAVLASKKAQGHTPSCAPCTPAPLSAGRRPFLPPPATPAAGCIRTGRDLWPGRASRDRTKRVRQWPCCLLHLRQRTSAFCSSFAPFLPGKTLCGR